MPNTVRSVLLCFLIALVLFVLSSLYMRAEVHFFIPPLVMLITIGTLRQATWTSLLIGCFLDVAAHSPRLGFFALCYILATLASVSCRRILAKDLFITLPILTYVYSMLASLFEIIFGFVFDIQLPSYSFTWVLNNTFLMPFFDVSYAILIFSLPHYMFSRYYPAKLNRR